MASSWKNDEEGLNTDEDQRSVQNAIGYWNEDFDNKSVELESYELER